MGDRPDISALLKITGQMQETLTRIERLLQELLVQSEQTNAFIVRLIQEVGSQDFLP
ncbi:MAG: hypothetical protein M3O95_02680 [Candidatus Dormibacteraeota bacterium]|nr:hypothetical protein [Candidatus Dormibacteraeota bacterium]